MAESVQIIDFDGTNLKFNERVFKKNFTHDELDGRFIVVVSIVGAFRTGKSFLLDYILRFLYANVSIKLTI